MQEAPSDANGFYAYAKGIEGAAHSEDSGRPSYTMQGAEAAGGGPRMRGVLQAADVSFADDEVDDIKELLIMPFTAFLCSRRGRGSRATAPTGCLRSVPPRWPCVGLRAQRAGAKR